MKRIYRCCGCPYKGEDCKSECSNYEFRPNWMEGKINSLIEKALGQAEKGIDDRGIPYATESVELAMALSALNDKLSDR